VNQLTHSIRVLGVIPARGGSKSIPRKNIADLAGKPLIAYSIESAMQSKLLTKTIVSTDCPEIAHISKTLGADVPFLRPANLATDQSASVDVVLHALKFMQELENVKYHAVMLLQPTTPFRKSKHIDKAISEFADSGVDSIKSVSDVNGVHPFRMYELDSKSSLVPFCPFVEDPMMPRQQLRPVYIRSGDIYLTSTKWLHKNKSLISVNAKGLIIDTQPSVNIDEPADLELARILVNNWANE